MKKAKGKELIRATFHNKIRLVFETKELDIDPLKILKDFMRFFVAKLFITK